MTNVTMWRNVSVTAVPFTDISSDYQDEVWDAVWDRIESIQAEVRQAGVTGDEQLILLNMDYAEHTLCFGVAFVQPATCRAPTRAVGFIFANEWSRLRDAFGFDNDRLLQHNLQPVLRQRIKKTIVNTYSVTGVLRLVKVELPQFPHRPLRLVHTAPELTTRS